LLILVGYKSVASGVHGEDRYIHIPIEGDVSTQVLQGCRVGCDTRSCGEGLQISIQAQTGLLVEGFDFAVVD